VLSVAVAVAAVVPRVVILAVVGLPVEAPLDHLVDHEGGARLRAGAYTRPLSGSTSVLSVGEGVHFRVDSGWLRGYQRVYRVYFLSQTAQVEMKSERV
jgi:hypothetical protein